MVDEVVRERLDLSSEEGQSLLKENARAVGNEDVSAARASSIALTEGEGTMTLPTDEEYGISERELTTNEYYGAGTVIPPKDEIVSQSVYGSLAANSGDTVASFQMISDELSLSGESPTYQQIADSVREDARFELSGVIEDTAMLGAIDEVNKLIVASPVILDERSNIRTVALDNSSENQGVKDPSLRGQEYQDWYRDRFEERINGRLLVNKAIDRTVADSSNDMLDIVADMAGTLVISEQLFLSRASKKILGESYYALGGDMKRDLATWILEPSKAKEQGKRAEEVAIAIAEAAGFKGSNDVVKVFALETVREYINTPVVGTDWFRMIDNIAGVVGVVPFISEAIIAKTLRNLFSVGKTAVSSGRSSKVLNDIQEADPDLASKLNAGVIKDENLSEALDITTSDATKRALPHGAFSDDVHLEGAPQQLLDDIEGNQTRADEIDNYLENTYMFSDADYISAERNILDIMEADKVVGIAKPSISTMRRVGNSIEVKAVYGADETNYPIETLAKAVELKAILEARFIDIRNIELNTTTAVAPKARILVKDEITGAFVTPDSGTVSTKPRYYVSIDRKMPMLFNDRVPEVELTGAVGKVKRWALDPNSYIARSVLGQAIIANDKKFFVAHELKSLATPFLTLRHNSKVRVADLLVTGEEQGKVFKYNDLVGEYSQKEIKAYFTTRQFNETVYRIKNYDLYSQLQTEGFKSVRVKVGDKFYENAGKPLTAEQASKHGIAFDPRTESSVDLTGTNSNKLYERGQVVVKLNTRLENGSDHFTHAVVNKSDIGELPTNVLPYRVGYNMLVNNDPYFIKSTFMTKLDGVDEEVTKVVGVAENSHKAKKWEDALNASDTSGKKFKVHLDRNIASSDSLLKQDYNVLDGSGPQFWYSRKGDRLLRQDGSLSAVQDPVETIHTLSQSIANTVTHKNMFESAIGRHQKAYGGIRINNAPLWQYNTEMKDYKYIGKEINESVHPEVRGANREYEYIESLKEMPVGVDLVWKNLMLGIDRAAASSSIASKVSKAVILNGLVDLGPTQFLRNTTFMMTIPLRPIKQLALQWTTGLSLMGIDPGATTRAFKDSALMSLSMASWDNTKRWNRFVVPAAKALGHNPEEWAEIFKQFRRTGKAYSIDSNVMISEANFGWSRSMPSSVLGRLGQGIRNVAIAPVTLGKRLGFDLGELGNQSVTYLFARERWIKANPDKVWNANQQNLDEIARAARNFSIDMTKTNLLPYQRGGLATLTQFMSINHKMLLKILRKDPDIQGSDHKRFISGLVVMYGAAGLGLQDYYEEMKIKEGLSIPSDLDDLFYGGVTQYMFNKSLDIAFGEEFGTTRLAVSDTFSPAAGAVNFPFELVKSVWESEDIAQALAGPSGHTFPRIGRAADHIQAIWGRKDFDTEEKLLEAGAAVINEFGFFSDRFNYNLAMSYKEQMDTYNVINRKGMIGVPSNQSELFGKMLFGLGTRNEGELYNIVLPLAAEFAKSKKGVQTGIEADGARVAEYWWKGYLTSNQDDKVFEDNVRPVMNALYAGGDRLYGEQVLSVARRLLTLKPDFNKLLTGIVERHKILDPEADMDMLRNVANHVSIINDKDKARNNRFLDEMERNVNNAKRILDEQGDF